MTNKDKVWTLMNDGVRRTSKRIAEELNIPHPSARRNLAELKKTYPGRLKQSRDPIDFTIGMVYWRV